MVNPTHAETTIESSDGNYYFAPDVANRVPYMIRTLVYIWAGLVGISILLMSRKPKDRVLAAEAKRKAKRAFLEGNNNSEELV